MANVFLKIKNHFKTPIPVPVEASNVAEDVVEDVKFSPPKKWRSSLSHNLNRALPKDITIFGLAYLYNKDEKKYFS